MDYEAEDRYMSSWVIACQSSSTRFYLTDDGLAADILSRATVRRWQDEAERVADAARMEYAWRGFEWQPMRVADARAF